MKIFVSAAEISSDIHAEKIIQALIQNFPQKTFQIAGIGGPKLRSIPAFQSVEQAENLRAMGFVEILGKLSFIRETLRQTARFIAAFQPDLILTFDYPDFHLRLMKQVKKEASAPGALKICAIPPKVWVWRSHRVERIRSLYDGVLVVFPFEKNFYESKGIPVIFEGNPLIANLLQAHPSVPAPLKPGEIEIAVMPGSRDAELKYHLPVLPGALQAFAEKTKQKVKALIPVPVGMDIHKFRSQLPDSAQVQYEFFPGGTQAVLARAPYGLIKSGTSTLEAAVLGCVPIIFYKANIISEWIFRLVVRYSGPVGLPNILLGVKDRKRAPFIELLGPEATESSLAEALARLHWDSNSLFEKRNAVQALKKELVPNENVSRQIALQIATWLKKKPYQAPARKTSFGIRMLSFLWSTVNWIRRRMLRSADHSLVPSVLFGNLQAGGAGKTPILIEFAKLAVKKGKRVGVITRGYGSGRENQVQVFSSQEGFVAPSRIGDEASEIKQCVPGIWLGVGANRVQVTKQLLQEAKQAQQPIDLILYDDGFQNLKFKATVTVLCVTDRSRSEIPFRDFLSEAKFAQVVLKTKGVGSIAWKPHSLPQVPIFLLCGVADPLEVEASYRKWGVDVVQVIAKPDHAVFTAKEVKNLMRQAFQAGALLAVTEKDAVKLHELGFTEAREITPNSFMVLRRSLQDENVLLGIFERLQS